MRGARPGEGRASKGGRGTRGRGRRGGGGGGRGCCECEVLDVTHTQRPKGWLARESGRECPPLQEAESPRRHPPAPVLVRAGRRYSSRVYVRLPPPPLARQRLAQRDCRQQEPKWLQRPPCQSCTPPKRLMRHGQRRAASPPTPTSREATQTSFVGIPSAKGASVRRCRRPANGGIGNHLQDPPCGKTAIRAPNLYSTRGDGWRRLAPPPHPPHLLPKFHAPAALAAPRRPWSPRTPHRRGCVHPRRASTTPPCSRPPPTPPPPSRPHPTPVPPAAGGRKNSRRLLPPRPTPPPPSPLKGQPARPAVGRGRAPGRRSRRRGGGRGWVGGRVPEFKAVAPTQAPRPNTVTPRRCEILRVPPAAACLRAQRPPPYAPPAAAATAAEENDQGGSR